MKKLITLIIAVIVCASACIGAFATTPSNNTIHIENTEVIFDNNSELSDDVKQHIAEHLVYGDSNVQTYGLTCTLFGHNYTTESVTTITHCVRDTAPRCLEEDWLLEVCSRCDDLVETRVSYSYIFCCD